MKFFENERFLKKIVIIILTITIFQFGFSKSVKAADSDDDFGSTLISPVIGLFVSLGDRRNEYNTFFYNGTR